MFFVCLHTSFVFISILDIYTKLKYTAWDACGVYWDVGGNLKKQLTTKNIQENEAISNCKIE